MSRATSRRIAKAMWFRVLGRHQDDPADRLRQRGQVLPIFAIMSVVLLGGAALVTDVAWWWTNEQQAQRAADAAALAGAVWLPGRPSQAFLAARAEAAKNGFTDGSGGVVVTPRRDPTDPRKLLVDVDTSVATNFARVFCWDGGPCLDRVAVGVTGAAVYTLPVPMGSPQNYYGVGFFQGVVPAVSQPQPPAVTDWRSPGTSIPTSGNWSNPDRAWIPDEANANQRYATRQTNNSNSSNSLLQAYRSFSVSIPNPANSSVAVNGIEVRLQALQDAGNGCSMRVALSTATNPGINDGSWTTVTREMALSNNESEAVVGGAADLWGRTFTEAQVESANLHVRVQARDPGSACADGTSVWLDHVAIRVHYTLTITTPESVEVRSVPDPGDPAQALASQGFWGAIFTSGGVRENGDRYAPIHIGANNPPDGTNGGPNPNYDANGYEYSVEVGANGQVRLFDPVFCAVGPNDFGGWFGAGDHWTTDGTGGGTTIAPVAVRFRLFDTRGTPTTVVDDIQQGPDLTYDPGNATLGDFSGQYNRAGKPAQNSGMSGSQDCSSDPAHNRWVLPTGWSGLQAGTYRLNVNTNLGQNANHGAENLFSIWVSGDSRARVYGGGRMAAYTNLDDTGAGGTQQFYFSQIPGEHAGKTMVITLFDPGEANKDSYLRFLTPYRGTYDYATFDWTSNEQPPRSGRGVTEIQTATSSGSLFNNRILTITMVLPDDYGDFDLDPENLGEDGWWKVEYDVRAGNDTTTWEVELRGSPVHLVPE